MFFPNKLFMGYFSFSVIALSGVSQNIPNFLFIWKVIIFLFLDIFGDKMSVCNLKQVILVACVPGKVSRDCTCEGNKVVAAASTLETGMEIDIVTPGCPTSSPRCPLMGPGRHPVPHPALPSHSLDPCGLVDSCQAEHQVPPGSSASGICAPCCPLSRF